MSVQTVARRYAAALADVVSERGEQRTVEPEIQYWAQMINSNPQLREIFANPTVAYEQKQRVLEELLARTRVSETSSSFLRVLLRNQRLDQIKEVAEKFSQLLDERSGVVAADVTTARVISEEAKAQLMETLAARTGKKVRLSFATDEKIIGGVIARIGSTVFDGSVQSQLERLAAELAGQ